MNFLSKIRNFTGANDNLFLSFAFAYIGEMLIKKAEKEVFRPHKISSVQYNILCTLSAQSPRPASSIAPFILGSAANFSAMLGRMESQGLITREPSKTDKREVFVFWTQKGETLYKKISTEFGVFCKETFQNISTDQKKEMSEHLSAFSGFL